MAEKYDLCLCPVCSTGDTVVPYLDGLDAVSVCTTCGLGIERTLTKSPGDVYKPDLYDGVRNAGEGSSRWPRFHHDSAVAVKRLAQIASFVADKLPATPKWIDVGANNGAVLAAVRRLGWSVLGVEATEHAAAELTNVLGFPAITFAQWSALANNPYPIYDVVSFFDVIEHLFDPVGTLITAAGTVAEKGLLVVEVPDFGTVEGPEQFKTWKHRRISREITEHIWHFAPTTLRAIGAKYFKAFDLVSLTAPVAGKLQAIWRKKGER